MFANFTAAQEDARRCDYVGLEPTEELYTHMNNMLVNIPVEALIRGMPWKGDVSPGVQYCVLLGDGLLGLKDFEGNFLYYDTSREVLASSPRGFSKHVSCYDARKEQTFSPKEDGRCW